LIIFGKSSSHFLSSPTTQSRLCGVILNESKDLKIYNSLGECVLSPLAFGEGPGVRLDISALTQGVYFLRLNNGKEMLNESFIVMR
jgi:hypothetical protein